MSRAHRWPHSRAALLLAYSDWADVLIVEPNPRRPASWWSNSPTRRRTPTSPVIHPQRAKGVLEVSGCAEDEPYLRGGHPAAAVRGRTRPTRRCIRSMRTLVVSAHQAGQRTDHRPSSCGRRKQQVRAQLALYAAPDRDKDGHGDPSEQNSVMVISVGAAPVWRLRAPSERGDGHCCCDAMQAGAMLLSARVLGV